MAGSGTVWMTDTGSIASDGTGNDENVSDGSTLHINPVCEVWIKGPSSEGSPITCRFEGHTNRPIAHLDLFFN